MRYTSIHWFEVQILNVNVSQRQLGKLWRQQTCTSDREFPKKSGTRNNTKGSGTLPSRRAAPMDPCYLEPARSCGSNDGNNTLILLLEWNSGNREATTTAEYELDQIGLNSLTEGIQMTRRHGPERNKQPAATRKAVPATIYWLSHDGNKTCNRGSGNNSNTKISEREFSPSSRTRNNPEWSSTLPSRSWTSGR